MEGNRSSNRLLGLSGFATVNRLSCFDFQSMEQDSSLLSLRGSTVSQGCRDERVSSTHLALEGSKGRLMMPRAILLLALLFQYQQVAAQGISVEVKQTAPYFILPTWDGKTLRSTSLKGKVVVLEFFQTWCPDCQKSGVELEKLYQKYKDRGLTIVGISHDREKAAVVAPYLKKYNITYPVLLGDISVVVNYIPGVTPQAPKFNIPYLILIDRDGNIVGRFQEGHEKEAMDINLLEERIRKLL